MLVTIGLVSAFFCLYKTYLQQSTVCRYTCNRQYLQKRIGKTHRAHSENEVWCIFAKQNIIVYSPHMKAFNYNSVHQLYVHTMLQPALKIPVNYKVVQANLTMVQHISTTKSCTYFSQHMGDYKRHCISHFLTSKKS